MSEINCIPFLPTLVKQPQVVITLPGQEHVEELRAALFRALNTWSDAPRWLHDLHDSLSPNPPPQPMETTR